MELSPVERMEQLCGRDVTPLIFDAGRVGVAMMTFKDSLETGSDEEVKKAGSRLLYECRRLSDTVRRWEWDKIESD